MGQENVSAPLSVVMMTMVLGNAQIVQLLQQHADVVVEFRHAGAIQTLFRDHRLILRLQ